MVNLYMLLNRSLEEYNLTWNDIEAIVIAENLHYNVRTSERIAVIRKLSKEKAKKFLKDTCFESYHKLVQLKPEERIDLYCNPPFYAYTKDRIFYMSLMGSTITCYKYVITSIPRNPVDTEIPRML